MTSSAPGWVLVGGWLTALTLVRSGSVEERDPYWQTRAGVETLHGAPLVRPDAWSWAPVEGDFTQTSPGWNLLLGVAWEGLRFFGLFLVSAVAIGSLLLLLVVISRRLGAGPLATLVGLTAVLLIALPFLSMRATVAAQALFLGSIVWADWWRMRAGGVSRPMGMLAVGLAAAGFSGVGSWLHLSWLLLAPTLALCWAVIWAASPRLGRARIVGFIGSGGLGAVAGVLLGPYGADAWQVTRAVQAACAGLITEWLGMFTPGLALRWAAPGILAILTAAASGAWAVRGWGGRGEDRRVGVVAALSVVALPTALAGLVAIRFIGVSLLALAPVLAMASEELGVRLQRRLAAEPRGAFANPRVRFWATSAHWRPVLVAVLVVLSPGVLLMTLPLARPLAEMAVLKDLPRGCRLVSDPGSAGPVILLRPDVRVWTDGRADYYGRQRTVEVIEVLGSASTQWPALDAATCVMLRRHPNFPVAALARALDADPEWSRVNTGEEPGVWVRSSP